MTAPAYAPFIVAPPLTSCETAYLVFGQGVPPYTIFPIGTGDSNGTSLESLPLQPNAGVFKWKVDFDPGANITFALVDGEKQTAFSVFRVVQTGATTHCARNVYSKPSSHLGPILGGVLGALGVLSLLFALYFLRRRYFPSTKKPKLPSHPPSETASVMDGATGLVRHGTFNLHAVQLNEESVDRLNMARSPPPVYHPPSQASSPKLDDEEDDERPSRA